MSDTAKPFVPSWLRWPPNCCETCTGWQRHDDAQWTGTCNELITALDLADGPSRELDREIGDTIGAPMGYGGDVVGLGYAKFTASIEAARTTVVSGMTWACGMWGENNRPWACVTNDGASDVADSDSVDYYAEAVDVAIALVIAAIKARAKGA